MLCCDYVRASPIEAVYVNIIITHLVCVCPKGRERFVTHDSMAPSVSAIWQKRPARMPSSNSDQFRAVDT